MSIVQSNSSTAILMNLAARCRALREKKEWSEIYRISAVSLDPESDFALSDSNVQWQILEEHGLAAYYLGKLDEALEYFLRVEAYDLTATARARTLKNLEYCDGPRFSQDWFDSQIPYWRQELSPYRGKPDLRFLEIGSFEGRATRWMLKVILTHPTSTIEVIDTFQGSAEHRAEPFIQAVSILRQTFEHNIREFKDRVLIHQGSSHDVLPMIAPLRQESYDFIYVDGSHHQDDVYKDAVLSWPLLKKDGILAFDDYTWQWEDTETGEIQSPSIGIDKFLSEHPGEFTLLHKEYQLHVRKELSHS